ncbi:DUF397 domain-containing protein [Streptomyces broussonetiae]|uniref:DUF397 domain-containing protein n=1 Tax=Streptomyces broussonetiae TaxID=2686304 RepID=A0A6I6N5B8_9ACTN|nr:DUF397 domain-containing protein [Streptomyces broussonetiae]QHA05839.1 DUF397 domain-containing protein [Streptomyces broussonetiae]
MIRKASTGDTSEPAWFKSSYSDGTEGDSRVEIAIAPRTVPVRDSKNVAGPRRALAPSAWADLVAHASRS